MTRELIKTVEDGLERLYVAADGARLRVEDRRKAVEVAAMLGEIERCVRKLSSRRRILLVDAAAGKSYVGLLAAKLVFERLGLRAEVHAIERVPSRAAAARRAAAILNTQGPAEGVLKTDSPDSNPDARVRVEIHCGDLGDPKAWPAEPAIVAALHACGRAADLVIDRSIASGAAWILLVPCCTEVGMAAVANAEDKARLLDIPRHAQVRRRFIQSCVDAERTLRLEAAGYQTEVVELVGATVTPHNLLWRARRVGEARRTRQAREALARWASANK